MVKSPVVSTSHGALRGSHEDGLVVFRGVPYATPPTGDLRWQPARPHPGWDGVRAAVEYGPTAPQPYVPGGSPVLGEHGSPPFDEDCLTLNIWTPGLDDARRPVLIWIHGGGFTTGSGNIPYYAGDTFARDGDLVAVTINYRLGALGFLHGMGDSANLWLGDQATALRWVADNISAFGGDPDAMTLVGQSGGGLSIGGLVQHPLSRGLFRRAIVQSAPLGLELPTPTEAFERTRTLARVLGHDDPAALRQEPVERLVDGTVAVMTEHAEFGQWNLAFTPVIDESTMPSHPAEALADPDLELVVGWTEDEATFAFALAPQYAELPRARVIEWLAKRHRNPEQVYDRYTRSGRDRPVDVLSAVCRDTLFRRRGLELVARRAESAPVYAYQFELDSPAFDGVLGATHCLDLPFTFANADRWTEAGFLRGFDPTVVARVTAPMHQAWIAFVRTGNPSHEGLTWPVYTSADKELVVFDATTEVVSNPAMPWHEKTDLRSEP